MTLITKLKTDHEMGTAKRERNKNKVHAIGASRTNVHWLSMHRKLREYERALRFTPPKVAEPDRLEKEKASTPGRAAGVRRPPLSVFISLFFL